MMYRNMKKEPNVIFISNRRLVIVPSIVL